MHPKDAGSPAYRIRNKARYFVDREGNWSLCEMEWLDEGEWAPAIGCRWNGDISDGTDKGSPTSSGYATWFILPEPFAQLARAMFQAKDAEIGDFEGD